MTNINIFIDHILETTILREGYSTSSVTMNIKWQMMATDSMNRIKVLSRLSKHTSSHEFLFISRIPGIMFVWNIPDNRVAKKLIMFLKK